MTIAIDKGLFFRFIILILLCIIINSIFLKKLSLNTSVNYYNKLKEQQPQQKRKQEKREKEMQTTTTATTSVSTPAREYWPNVYERDDQGLEKLSTWSMCTVHTLGIDHTIGMVQIELNRETGRLLLSPVPKDYTHPNNNVNNYDNNNASEKKNKVIVPIGHPSSCPFKALLSSKSHQQFLKDSPPINPIKVGVSILIQDKYDRVFLTKRASTMRIFPSFWVLPGGHMEKGETFEETALRELLEETGIDLVSNHKNVNLTVFGAYESTYPLYLTEGKLPTDHHTVIYERIKIDQDIDNNQIKLEPNEVEIGAWLPLSLLAQMFQNRGKGYEFKDSPHDYTHFLQRHSSSSPSTSDDSSDELEIHYSQPHGGESNNNNNGVIGSLKQSFLDGNENISAGTVFILKQYLNLKIDK